MKNLKSKHSGIMVLAGIISAGLDFMGTASKSKTLGKGQHIVTIDKAPEIIQKEVDKQQRWLDRTPQLAVHFLSTLLNLGITCWYNLLGYKRRKDITAADIHGITGAMVGVSAKDWAKYSFEDKVNAIFRFEGPEGDEYAVANVTAGNLTKDHRLAFPPQAAADLKSDSNPDGEEPNKTTLARNIVGQLFVDGGGKVGQAFNESMLTGLTVGIVVDEGNNGQPFVKYSMDPAKVV